MNKIIIFSILSIIQTTVAAPYGDLIQVATESGKFTRLLKAATDLGLVEKFNNIWHGY